MRAVAGIALVTALLALACATRSDPWSYRLAGGGAHWTSGADDPLLVSLSERYPAFFEVMLDPGQTREPDLRPLRHDLEREPVDQGNYDALNAVAMGYFELNWRAAESPGGNTYFADSFRAAKLLSLPWRAYGLVDDGQLRDAILDFFEDAASGDKPGTAATAPRLAGIVASLEAKEQRPDRRARIHALAEELRQRAERQRAEAEAENAAP